MNAIEIRDLTKVYPGFTLGPLTMTLPQGCILGLVGANGAGKSTTIKLLLELLRPDKGEVVLLGQKTAPSQETRQDMGVVLDSGGLPQCITPRQLGTVMAGLYRHWDQAQYEALLYRFALDPQKKVKTFSQGMRRKLEIAIALSHRPKLLIMDEPTAGLDPLIRDEILDLFLEFTRQEDCSILLSSHIVSDLEKLCDYIAFLHQGKLLVLEEKDRLKEQYGLAHMSREDYKTLPQAAVLGKKEGPYGLEVVVRREMVTGPLSPVDLEQLFIFMTKEAYRQ